MSEGTMQNLLCLREGANQWTVAQLEKLLNWENSAVYCGFTKKFAAPLPLVKISYFVLSDEKGA